jgi:hypothetical protein
MTCLAHVRATYYYISTAIILVMRLPTLLQIFKQTACADIQVYAAAIGNATENTCITILVAYYKQQVWYTNDYAENWCDVHNPG